LSLLDSDMQAGQVHTKPCFDRSWISFSFLHRTHSHTTNGRLIPFRSIRDLYPNL